MIRVCWISPNFRAPYVGGGNRMFSNLFSSMTTGDVEVHVITNILPSSDAINQNGFIVHGVDMKHHMDTYRFTPDLQFILRAGCLFLKLHRRLGFDIVQILSSLPPLGLYLALLAKAGGCKSVLGFLDFPLGREELNGLHRILQGRPFWYRLLYRAAFGLPTRLWFRWLDGFIVVSQTALSFLRDTGMDEAKIFLVPPGVDLQLFQPRNGSHRPPYQILYASSCYPWKGVFDLLEAFRMVLDLGFPAELLYVFSFVRSESKTGKVFISRLEQRISEMGLKDRAVIRDSPMGEIEKVIAQADILACPLQSGVGTVDIPLSILESMACGLPVIGTRVGAMSEVILEGVNGYLVEPSAPAALAGAMMKMIEDPAKMKRMGEESSRLAQGFDVRKSASLLREMYSTVISKG